MPEGFIILAIILFVVNLALIAYAIMDLMQRKNVKYLPKIGWIIFIAFVFLGSIIYLLVGRGKDTKLETTRK